MHLCIFLLLRVNYTSVLCLHKYYLHDASSLQYFCLVLSLLSVLPRVATIVRLDFHCDCETSHLIAWHYITSQRYHCACECESVLCCVVLSYEGLCVFPVWWLFVYCCCKWEWFRNQSMRCALCPNTARASVSARQRTIHPITQPVIQAANK